MIQIDGRMGEGGGQVLRTALAMSLVTQTPIEITHIRAKRPSPGLKPQHVAAVKAAALVGGDADVEGGEPGSMELSFKPRGTFTGAFRFDVGTAGSTMLVLQTVLPALIIAKETSQIVLEGGTHNPLAPTFGFVERAYLPLIAKLGAKVTMKLERPGFYPAGGGKVRVQVEPAKGAKIAKLSLLERGDLKKRRGYAAVVELPAHIIERELKVLKLALGFKPLELRAAELGPGRSPGNVVHIEFESENVTEVITAIGAKNIRAEQVAENAAAEAKRYLDSGVPVGPYLADQLLVLLAIGAGGTYRTMEPTPHTNTQIDLLKSAFGVDASVVKDGKTWVVSVAKRRVASL